MNEPSGLKSSSNSTTFSGGGTTAARVLERPGCTLRHLSELLSDTSLRKMFETGCGGGDANHHNAAPTLSGAAATVATGADPPTDSTALTHHFADLYEQDRKLRSGSFGTVYTCHYKMDDPVVMYAVKVLDRRKLKVKDVSAVFREVKILGDLGKLMAKPQEQQPDATGEQQQRRYHIIKLVDFFVEPTYLYVVQEFAHGGDLFDKLTSMRSYTEWDAAIISRKLLETIDFLHGREIVHRDLKPENLLLRDANDKTSILVADFGFARYVPPKPDYCQTRCGTPSFVGPEILLGVPYGTSVDMWSVGCIIYMLISGYAPFQAPNHRGLFRKVRAGDFTFHEQTWKKVSLEAKQLISHLLTVNAKHRYTAAQALQSRWFEEKPDQLKQNDLSGSLDGMKEFVPKNAWKRAVIALGFCSHAPFWNPDALTFSQQMNKWDHQEAASSKDGQHHKSSGHVMHKLSANRKFEDRYVLQKQLRKGSHATVWQCVHRKTEVMYAVKIIHRAELKPKDDEAVLNEVALMQSLMGDKYVVQVLDFYEEEDYFYIVMEYYAGGDVFDRIVKLVHYTEYDARALAIVLLKAVGSIHENGIAHRDIKPQNLFLSSTSDNTSIRVGDFGFAKRVHTPESLTSRVGTPTYVAPEILKNLPHDERVDLWSVGIVIFVLLVGYPPFLDEDQSNLFRKIRTGEWTFIDEDWKQVSDDAKDLIRGLLAVDPQERWTIDECLGSKWIGLDPATLSENDLSDSLRCLQSQKKCLRSSGIGFTGLLDSLRSVSVATQAQESVHQPMEVDE